jgi:bifunctional UDP-N-acetylglucosamine pyrophosphorylase/glucosamine-1-phosphate N-acetyltransferase
VTETRPAAVIVLAAGEGTRMKSATPKVLHTIGGRSLVGHVVAACERLDPDHLVVVVGHGRDAVTAHLADISTVAKPVVQEQQDGTGHAVRLALEALPDVQGTIVVVAGDTPLLSAGTLASLTAQHVEDGNAATVLTAILDDPTGYGRVLRDDDSKVTAIVEHKDADEAQRAVREVNSGMYAFDAVLLREALGAITRDNVQGEEYLTDVLGILGDEGHRIGAVIAADRHEILGVNDRVQLAAAGAYLRQRIAEAWMRAGVTITDPATTWIGVDVTLEADATLLPNVQLHGQTSIGTGASIGPDTTLHDTVVGPRASVVRSHAIGAEIGEGASVGPFSYLRPGTRLGARGKIGAFVETKNSVIGEGSKVPHLSYVGDARIGKGSNVGAATVFVNYDGVAKHETTVGDHVRIGSDTMLVAPIDVGDGAYTAAGSVITEDIPPGAMAVARSRQRNIEGWVTRKRAGTTSAEAAEQAAAAKDSSPNRAQPEDDGSVDGG